MHVVVGGGTGFIGKVVVRALLAQGRQVTVVSRSAGRVRELFSGKAEAASMDSLPGKFDAAVNLAGEPVAQRWSARAMREIRDSRVNSTAALRKAAEESGASTFVAGSAVGFYGDTGNTEATEESAPGKGFLSETCIEWEAAGQSSTLRVPVVRVGFTVGPGAPGVRLMARPFRMFVGGAIAGGGAYMPWVHVADVCAMILWALDTPGVSGPLNAVAPAQATNLELSRALARALHRPCWAPVPAFAIRLLFGRMGEVVLASQRVAPRRAQELGFKFQHTDLAAAMRDSV